jgi:hypothetical protein
MISTSCLEKPPQTTLRLCHIYHCPDHYGPYSSGSRSPSRSACTKFGRKTLQSVQSSSRKVFNSVQHIIHLQCRLVFRQLRRKYLHMPPKTKKIPCSSVKLRLVRNRYKVRLPI